MFFVVDDVIYIEFVNFVYLLGMGVLMEISIEEEFERVLILGVKIIGVNNCYLYIFIIDMNCIVCLVEKYCDCIFVDVCLIFEFGVYNYC